MTKTHSSDYSSCFDQLSAFRYILQSSLHHIMPMTSQVFSHCLIAQYELFLKKTYFIKKILQQVF